MMTRKQLKRKKQRQDYERRRNVVRNSAPKRMSRGYELTAGSGILPASKKMKQYNKAHANDIK